MRRLSLGLAFAVAFAGSVAATPEGAVAQRGLSPGWSEVGLRVQPIAAFQPSRPERTRFGPLEFRGGLVLAAEHPAFGGISGLRILPDGERFLAVTDQGVWMTGRFVTTNGRLAGLEEFQVAPMIGRDGRTLRGRHRDTEALAIDGGTAFVSAERIHRILRFDVGRDGPNARGVPVPAPAALAELPDNQGLEALALAPARSALRGALVAISERGLDAAGDIRGWIIGGPTPGAFSVRRSDDFDITDAAFLPDGDLLVLERRFSIFRGLAVRLRRIAGGEIAPGARLDGPVLLAADGGYDIDNLEALAVSRGPQGETLITLASDDNFSRLQRTIVLRFVLTGEP